MSHHPFTGGNNGGEELVPEQNESQSNRQTMNNRSGNPKVNNNRQKSTFVGQRSTPAQLPVNSGSTYIFYKTRMCHQFVDEGNCRNGDKCAFAHGPKDLHQPPSNWHEIVKDNGYWNDDENIIQRMRICRKFYYLGRCKFGEKCSFLHQSPDRFKVQQAIVSGQKELQNVTDPITTEPLATDLVTGVRVVPPRIGRGFLKLATGSGITDLQRVTESIKFKPLATGSTTGVRVVPPRIERGFLKLGNKKLVGIYADWIDDGDYLKQNH